MKKYAILLASLLSLIACSNSADSKITSSQPSSFSFNPILDLTNYEAKGLSESDIVTNRNAYIYGGRESVCHYESFVGGSGNSDFTILHTYEEMIEFEHSIEERMKAEYGQDNDRRHIYYSDFRSHTAEDFVNRNYVVARETMLTSGSNSFRFRDLYLKDNILYVYMGMLDINDFPGLAGITNIEYVGISFDIGKDISYDRIEFLVDKYLPGPNKSN